MARGFAILATIVAAAALAPACFDESELEGAACLSSDDCWRTQSCVRTQTEINLMAPGECRSDDACDTGMRLGCSCLPGASVDEPTRCEGTDLSPTSNDLNTCICCGESDAVDSDPQTGLLFCTLGSDTETG
jgi:hypothetical protein